MGALIEYGAILAIALVVALLLFIAIRAIAHGLFSGEGDAERVEMEVLDEELARGEISQKEHDEAKRVLRG